MSARHLTGILQVAGLLIALVACEATPPAPIPTPVPGAAFTIAFQMPGAASFLSPSHFVVNGNIHLALAERDARGNWIATLLAWTPGLLRQVGSLQQGQCTDVVHIENTHRIPGINGALLSAEDPQAANGAIITCWGTTRGDAPQPLVGRVLIVNYQQHLNAFVWSTSGNADGAAVLQQLDQALQATLRPK